MARHYTATIEVYVVEDAGTIAKTTRDKQDVARIVVRADTLESLQKKLSAHVALIEN